jgi:hypothetical protein
MKGKRPNPPYQLNSMRNTVVSNHVNSKHIPSFLYQRLQCTDNYFFKTKFVLFLYLLLSASWKENDLSWYISVIRQTVRYWTPVYHQNHVVWQTKIKSFWRNGNDSKQQYSKEILLCDVRKGFFKLSIFFLMTLNKDDSFLLQICASKFVIRKLAITKHVCTKWSHFTFIFCSVQMKMQIIFDL